MASQPTDKRKNAAGFSGGADLAGEFGSG